MNLTGEITHLLQGAGQDVFRGKTSKEIEEVIRANPRFSRFAREAARIPPWVLRALSTVTVKFVKLFAKRFLHRSLSTVQGIVLETALDGIIDGIIESGETGTPANTSISTTPVPVVAGGIGATMDPAIQQGRT